MSQAPPPSAPLIVMAVCHYDDTNASGGLEKQTRLLSRTLAEIGETVVVLGSTRKLSNTGWRQDGSLHTRLFWTYASPQVSGRYLPAALIWALQLFFWVALNHRRISVFHCHQIRIHAFVAALARKLFGVPTVLKSAVGGTGADIRAVGSHKYFGAAGRRFIIHNTDAFVATTNSIRQDLLSFGVPDECISVIPNGVAIGGAASAACSDDKTRARRCVFLARLNEDKNTLVLAAAAQNVFSNAEAQLDFYGEGADKDALQTAISAHPNAPVAYKGYASNPHEILDAYGWLILPSNAEGLTIP
jgi:L-malate glycosyltransferase